MFKHTMASVNIIKKELSVFSHLANIISSLFIMGYIIFSIVMDRGLLGVNIALLAVTFINLIVYVIVSLKQTGELKKIRKVEKHIYKLSKICLNAIPLGTVIYSLAVDAGELSQLELVFMPLIILLWVVQVALEITTLYVESRLSLFTDGIKLDLEPIFKIKNAWMGESKKETPPVSEKHRSLLTEEIESKEEDEVVVEDAPVAKEGVFTRLSNVASAVKELIKK